MLKTVKGKVIAGTIAVVVFSSAGVAFGASDAGTNLKAWFDAQFNTAMAGVVTNVTDYGNDKKADFEAEFEGMKTGATAKINETEVNARTTASENIETDLNEHIDSLNEKRAELETYMQEEFAALFAEASQRIYDAGTEMSVRAESEMVAHTGEVGTAALSTLNTQLTETTNNALEELEVAINNAKSGLSDQLDSTATVTTDELKKLIDKRIQDVRYWTTFMTNFMVQEQEDLIVAAAAQFEANAKADMQALVNGINE